MRRYPDPWMNLTKFELRQLITSKIPDHGITDWATVEKTALAALLAEHQIPNPYTSER